MPAKAIEWTMRLREQLSDLDVFLSECTVAEGGASVAPSDVYTRYESWCEVNGVAGREKLTGVAFGKSLTGKGYPVKVGKIEGKSARVRIGLRLR